MPETALFRRDPAAAWKNSHWLWLIHDGEDLTIMYRGFKHQPYGSIWCCMGTSLIRDTWLMILSEVWGIYKLYYICVYAQAFKQQVDIDIQKYYSKLNHGGPPVSPWQNLLSRKILIKISPMPSAKPSCNPCVPAHRMSRPEHTFSSSNNLTTPCFRFYSVFGSVFLLRATMGIALFATGLHTDGVTTLVPVLAAGTGWNGTIGYGPCWLADLPLRVSAFYPPAEEHGCCECSRAPSSWVPPGWCLCAYAPSRLRPCGQQRHAGSCPHHLGHWLRSSSRRLRALDLPIQKHATAMFWPRPPIRAFSCWSLCRWLGGASQPGLASPRWAPGIPLRNLISASEQVQHLQQSFNVVLQRESARAVLRRLPGPAFECASTFADPWAPGSRSSSWTTLPVNIPPLLRGLTRTLVEAGSFLLLFNLYWCQVSPGFAFCIFFFSWSASKSPGIPSPLRLFFFCHPFVPEGPPLHIPPCTWLSFFHL